MPAKATEWWEQLRAPFDPSVIGKLPKLNCAACAEKKTGPKSQRHCDRHTVKECSVCGNYLTTGHIHLDYVGHAATTDRLIAVDPEWTWRPMATEIDTGFPKFDANGGLWILLTVHGITRPGYGDGATPKIVIGDAIRNAAMRFGVALDLWAKEDLQAVEESPSAPAAPPAAAARASVPTTPAPGADGDEHKRAHETKSTLDIKEPDRRTITQGQWQKLMDLAGPDGYRLSGGQLRAVIHEVTGQEKAKAIPRYKFDAVLAAVDLAGKGIVA